MEKSQLEMLLDGGVVAMTGGVYVISLAMLAAYFCFKQRRAATPRLNKFVVVAPFVALLTNTAAATILLNAEEPDPLSTFQAMGMVLAPSGALIALIGWAIVSLDKQPRAWRLSLGTLGASQATVSFGLESMTDQWASTNPVVSFLLFVVVTCMFAGMLLAQLMRRKEAVK